jgi:glycogen operon protein
MALPGDQIAETDDRAECIRGDSFAILFNAHDEVIPFRLGTRRLDLRWKCILDTGAEELEPPIFAHMSTFPLQAHSLAVLQAIPLEGATTL